jgi:NADH:ubiquinone oxidoreductase subunit 2 (subunit N)
MAFNSEIYFYSSYYLYLLHGSLFNEGVFIIFFLNLLVYIITLTLFFFLFSLISQEALKSMNSIGILSAISSLKFFFLLGILSLCGIPPLLGFFAKMYIFINLFNTFSYFLLFIFFIFNLFAMYFYLQNTRYLIANSNTKVYRTNFHNFYVPSDTASTLILLTNTLIFSMIYLDTSILMLHNAIL